MKKMIVLLSFAVAGLLSGCAGNTELIKASSVGTRNDVFREARNGDPIAQGDAELRIASSLKTHKPGVYLLEEKIHGTPGYKFLINIDGQVTEVTGSLQEENCEPRRLRDPEAGDGIRYLFRKALRLKAGSHKLVVALPEDGVVAEKDITLAEGKVNNLELEPLYGSTVQNGLPAYYAPTSFFSGVNGLRVTINDRLLQ